FTQPQNAQTQEDGRSETEENVDDLECGTNQLELPEAENSGSQFTQPDNDQTQPINPTPYQCLFEGCNKLFKWKCRLDLHLRTHSGVKLYKCPECDKSFTKKGNLAVHHRTVHLGEKLHQCPE